MRKLCTCLFYGLCVFTIVFSLFWMALPKLSLPVPDPGSEAPPSSAADLAAQAMPELAAQSYRPVSYTHLSQGLRRTGGGTAATCRL